MIAGTFSISCGKGDLVGDIMEKINDKIKADYPNLAEKFELEELRVNKTLQLPETMRLYSLV